MLDSIAPARQIVTSSDLVRHFGYWQDRAARTPVYILHRGRPRLVLTSVEIMDALCAPHFAGQGCGPDLAAVLERIEDRVVIANDQQQIVGASAGARRHFGAAADSGRALGRIVPEEVQPQLANAIDRVARTGIPLAIDLPWRLPPGGTLALLIDTWPGGLMLVAREPVSHADVAEGEALDRAIAATAAITPVRIDLRGRLETEQVALAALCAVDVVRLAALPFATLFASASRNAIGEALDRVIATGQSCRINALLIASRTAPLRMTIGFAPRHSGAAIVGIAAALLAAVD